MSFDTVGFLQHYGIPHVTEGHKHTRPGWIQVECPFCVGNPGWHLGYEIATDRWNCWRCGYKRTWDVVVALLHGNLLEARSALSRFRGRPVARQRRKRRTVQELSLPDGLQPLTRRARAYLASRKFDPDMLEAFWHLQSTSNIGRLKYRIFIPIFLDAQMVSWQCRDITGHGTAKYLAQSEDKEIVNNKETLYGVDHAGGKACVVVEGVTGVWRLGPGSVATFGIKYSPSQVAMLAANFREFHILYDPDPQAVVQAESLAADLSVLGGKTKIWYLDSYDPGDMPQDEADAFMREVGVVGY